MELSECRIGQRVLVLDGPHDWFDGRYRTEEFEATRSTTIIGILTETRSDALNVVVYKPVQFGGYDVNDDCGNTYPLGWKVCARYLKLVKDLSPITPYPNRCNVCKAPARKVNKITLCSRDGCKSKSGIRKYGKPVPIIATGVDIDNYAICPMCAEHARTATGDNFLTCSNQHRWPHKWLNGQKIFINSQSYYVYIDGIFNVAQL